MGMTHVIIAVIPTQVGIHILLTFWIPIVMDMTHVYYCRHSYASRNPHLIDFLDSHCHGHDTCLLLPSFTHKYQYIIGDNILKWGYPKWMDQLSNL